MTVAGGVDRRAGLGLHSRICAAVTAASCLLHVWLVAGNQHGLWLNVLMLAMVAVCLPCALHIWRHGQVRALRRVTASALAMTAVHALLLLGAGAGDHIHHETAAAPAAAGAAFSSAGALLAIIAVEVTTAMLAATLLARHRARPAGSVQAEGQAVPARLS